MRFAVIFLFTSKIDILELNLRTPIDMTEWHVFTDKSLPYSCSNRCGKVNIELHIDWSTAKPTAPPTTILHYQSRVQKELYFDLII
jgi:hypothetical protein